MSDNKFIKRLKGEQTAKSVLEIKNESAKTSFANMPQGTSNAINVYSDNRGNATAVLEGTDIWKLNNSQFAIMPNAFGDGRDFTSTYTVTGSSLWVNATHTFDQPKIFTGATQWTLKLCGHSLLSSLSNTIGFSLIIKFGNAVTITKSFSVGESAFEFCKEFIIDFSESEQSAIKVANGDTMTVQLLCADATASATIYNGMTTLIAQQRRVDGEAVASDLHTFEDLEVEIADVADDLADHIADKNNPHEVTKAQVGLGNCDNTSDINKPISTATQTALDGKVDKTTVANKVYGTDADGNQTTYDKGSFGQVDDVQVNNVSVVTDKVAKIDLTPYAKSADLATVATSGSYNDLSNKPTIPTVGNGTITFTQGGTTMGSFTTNQSGDQTIALDSGGYHPDLFDVKWADHICNDVQWLRADTFSWQSGAVYQVAYQHLADDITGKTLQSETISGTTIQFYLADDGHKICPASEESNVTAIYNATGVAWYYIIDTTNQRFKLPRTKFGFTGIRSGVGKFVEAGLPNITAKVQFTGDTNAVAGGGAAYATDDFRNHDIGGGGGVYSASSVLIDASEQNAIYGNSDTVQPKATEMYLYFYVGNFTQTALENTAGLNTELFNDKLDLDLGNAASITKSAIIGLLTPDYENAVQYTNNAPATYTTTEPCWICCKGASLAYNMTIGNTTIAEFLFSANYTSSWVFCPAGCTLTRVTSSQYNNFIVVPLKG